MSELTKHIIQVLKVGKTILCASDSIWGLGRDATSVKAVKKIYKLKKRKESASLVILLVL